MTTSSSIQEQANRLAAVEVDKMGWGKCGGTGKVPLFEGVRDVCLGCDGTKYSGIRLHNKFLPKCYVCGGTGYVATLGTDKWLFALEKLGYPVYYRADEDKTVTIQGKRTAFGHGETFGEAFLAAVQQVAEIECNA